MINVHPKGRLGNQMFQYCLARIISDKLDYGIDMKLPFDNAKALNGKTIKTPVEQLTGHEIDLKQILNNTKDRRIYLNGYFQRYEYYKEYKNEIRKWFEITESYRKPAENDLVVHVRGGDLYNKSVHPQLAPCPLSYYRDVIEKTDYDKLYIVTEKPDDMIAQAIRERYYAEIISQSVIEDYYFMFHATKLVLSVCTIAWWAGWLGNATEVHFPLLGYWSCNSVRKDIDLIVNEQRYIYHELEVQDCWQATDEQIKNLLK